MKRAIKKEGGLSEYLQPFVATGDEQSITLAKKEYRRRYKAAWRKAKRQTQKTFEISFDKTEWGIIKKAKHAYNRSYTNFIKNAALAYCKEKYLVPDQLVYNNVCQALYMAYNKLKDIN